MSYQFHHRVTVRNCVSIYSLKSSKYWPTLDRRGQMNGTAIPWRIFFYRIPLGRRMKNRIPQGWMIPQYRTLKSKLPKYRLKKKLNTVNPHVPLSDVSVFCDIIYFFFFLFRLQTWVLTQRTDEQTSIHDRWFGWSIRASNSSFRSPTCYNDINAVVIDGKESFADLKNPHPPRLRGSVGAGGALKVLYGETSAEKS